jgi:hypothetical protein
MIKKSFTARTKFNRAQRKSQLAIQAITIGDLSARFQFHVAVVQWSVETPREIASRHICSFSPIADQQHREIGCSIAR